MDEQIYTTLDRGDLCGCECGSWGYILLLLSFPFLRGCLTELLLGKRWHWDVEVDEHAVWQCLRLQTRVTAASGPQKENVPNLLIKLPLNRPLADEAL